MALFEPLFRSLNQAGIRYVVVGGLAVVLQGHARMTVDLDLVIDLDEDQVRRTIDVLVGLGMQPRVPVDPRDFADRGIRETWIRDRGMQVFTMLDRANPLRVVDLFAEHQLPFDDLWERADRIELQGTEVRVASIPDLIHLKRLSGRPQDHSDIERLEAILRRRNEVRE